MPTFDNIEVSTLIDLDFEVYCGTCGAGLCSVSDTRKSRNRGYLQVTVEACPDCMKSKDNEISDLKAEIDRLTAELENKE